MVIQPPTIVLASRSAARRAMLEAVGLKPVLRPVNVDEAGMRAALAEERFSIDDAAVALAEAKAARASMLGRGDEIVIGADQMLERDEHWFEKAEDPAVAFEKLRMLRGKSHRLVSAIVAYRRGQRVWSDTGVAMVRMRALSDAEIEAYLALAGEAALRSLGGYEIEGLGANLIDHYRGDYHAILGMRLFPLLQFLRDQGADPLVAPPPSMPAVKSPKS